MENVENYTAFEKACMETAKWLANHFITLLVQKKHQNGNIMALAINRKDFLNLFYNDFNEELYSKEYREHYEILVRTFLNSILRKNGYSCHTWTRGIFKKDNYVIVIPYDIVKTTNKAGILKQTFPKYKVIGKIAYV